MIHYWLIKYSPINSISKLSQLVEMIHYWKEENNEKDKKK